MRREAMMWQWSARGTRESKRACLRQNGAAHGRLYDQSRRGGQHALQPGNRRHGKKRTSVRGAGRAGRRMAKAADRCCIQYRMLNLGRVLPSTLARAGRPAEISGGYEARPRAAGTSGSQAGDGRLRRSDRRAHFVCYDAARRGAGYEVKAVVIASGTYLTRASSPASAYSSGPDGMQAGIRLTECLKAFGLRMRRFKTGTPPRINRRSVDVSKWSCSRATSSPCRFRSRPQKRCRIRRSVISPDTNEETHRIIRENFARSPLFNGMIESVGPRYCPSIETKIDRFPISRAISSLSSRAGWGRTSSIFRVCRRVFPRMCRLAMVHTIAGLEHAEMMRPAYAIEYDCVDPTELLPTLESKRSPGLWRGQFNGSSGYEEAAVQGFVAGVNAALKIGRARSR